MMFSIKIFGTIPKGHLHQFLTTLTGSLAIVCLGMHFGWSSPYIPRLLRNDTSMIITTEESSWVVIMPCFGGVVGAIVSALILDRIGRKYCMLLVSPIYFSCWLLITYDTSLIVLYCARFFVGIADGLALTAFPIYVCEIADSRIRGFLCSFISIGILLGLLLINVLGSYFSITTTALISAVVPILHFLTFLWVPESPYFHVLKNRDELAYASLKKFKGLEDVTEELKQLKAAVKAETENVGNFLDLLVVDSNRKALLIVMLVRGVQQFSGYTAITFYTQAIFEESGGFVSSTASTVIYISVQLVVALLTSTIVDKAGRRPLLITSILGSGLALAVEGYYFYLHADNPENVSNLTFLPLAALLLFIIMFYIGLGTIPVIILGELFPTNVKAFAMCIADIYYSLVVALVSKVFHDVTDKYGMHIAFFGFSGCCVVGLFLVIYCVPETNRRSLEEIHKSLKKSNCVESQIECSTVL